MKRFHRSHNILLFLSFLLFDISQLMLDSLLLLICLINLSTQIDNFISHSVNLHIKIMLISLEKLISITVNIKFSDYLLSFFRSRSFSFTDHFLFFIIINSFKTSIIDMLSYIVYTLKLQKTILEVLRQ